MVISNFVEKNDNFCQIFGKKCQVFGNFRQSNGNFPEGQVPMRRMSTTPEEMRIKENRCINKQNKQTINQRVVNEIG